MGASSKIEWTEASWTPIRARNLNTGKVGWHCEHATTGCEFCYAEGMNKRLGTGLPFKPGHRRDVEIFLDEEMLAAPLRWKKPRRVFVCSMTDAFADFVKDEWLDKMFAVMALCPQHTFQVLTKRAERMRDYACDLGVTRRIAKRMAEFCTGWGDPGIMDREEFINQMTGWTYLPNVWLGVSCERQQEADERIPLLLQTPAAVRFISAEPLLGSLSLRWAKWDDWTDGDGKRRARVDHLDGARKLDWVIAGGESGPNARPMHPDWARSLRDECVEGGVSFFFKQWGAWSDTHPDWPRCKAHAMANDGTLYAAEDIAYPDGPRYGEAVRANHDKARLCSMYLLGKKSAGRLLDGRTWNEMPEVGG